MKWQVCYTNLCNTEKSFCDKCGVDKKLDICSDDYSKPSQKTGEDGDDTETGTVDDNQSQVVTEDSKTDGEDAETGNGTVDDQSQVVTEDSKTDGEDAETGNGTVDDQSQVVTEDSKKDEKDDSEASKEDHKDDASETSNQLITHSWFLILLLSFVPNVIHF